MGLFDDALRADQTLVRNEPALDYEFLPKILRFRESEQQYLATALKPLFQQRSGRNQVVVGAPGIGKTAAVRHVLNELEEQTDDIVPLYINCWQFNTSYKVFAEICHQMGYTFTQNKKTTELQKIALQLLNKTSCVLVFDEIDKAEDKDFIYVLVEGVYRKAIFLITNFKSWLVELDQRIRSRLAAEMTEFRPYTREETKGILQERVDIAFYEGVWSDDVFEKVVDKTAKLKDIRSGLFLLKTAALEAEDHSRKQVLAEDVDVAIQKLDEFTIKNPEGLDDETQFVLKIVKNNSGKKIGEMFALYESLGGTSSYKTFQRKIAKLEEGKFVKLTKQTGAGGNTTIVEKKLTEF